MSVWGYVRSSTLEQATEGNTMEDQERRVRGVAMMRGIEVDHVFADPGVSGSVDISARPAGGRMMQALQPGDTIIAAKLDRCFRSARDALETAERLQKKGVALILADMGVEPVTESGVARLFFTMLAAFAEFERTRIAERMAEGKSSKRRSGGHAGGEAPYGWVQVGVGRDARLERNEDEQVVIRRVRALRASGVTLRKICYALTEEGYRTRTGREFVAEQIVRILDAKRPSVPEDVAVPFVPKLVNGKGDGVWRSA